MIQEITNYRKKVDQALKDYRGYKKQLSEEKRRLEEAQERLSISSEGLHIIQTVSQKVQQQAHDKIAGVVTLCLNSIFPDKDYKFQIVFERKRSRTEAKLIFLKGDKERDPIEDTGGGIVDVAAFALRLSSVILHKPPLRKTLILDEPFKNVSKGYHENVKTLLEKVSEDFGVQIIMVTHIGRLKIGKVIKLK